MAIKCIHYLSADEQFFFSFRFVERHGRKKKQNYRELDNNNHDAIAATSVYVVDWASRAD